MDGINNNVTSKQERMKKLLHQLNALVSRNWDATFKKWNIKLIEYARASSYAIHR